MILLCFNTTFFIIGQTPTFFAPNPYVSGNVVAEKSFYGVANFVIINGIIPFYPLLEIAVKAFKYQFTYSRKISAAEGAN